MHDEMKAYLHRLQSTVYCLIHKDTRARLCPVYVY